MTRNLIVTLAVSVVAWLVLAVPARRLFGDEHLVYSTVATGLCVLPALGSLVLVGLAGRISRNAQLYAVLAGTFLRLGLVLLGALFFYLYHPYFQGQTAFLYWLLIFYLITLVLEKTLLLRRRSGLLDDLDRPSASCG